MGGSVSCCISPGESPKVHRRQVELEECPITTTEDVSEDTGTYLQHISDRELPEGWSIQTGLGQYMNTITSSSNAQH